MKNILISGGNFVNKGAEAMLYIAVYECLKRYPNCICTIQLADGFYDVDSLDALYQLSTNKDRVTKGKLAKLKEMIFAYKKAELMLDVSGYELCSKLGIYPSLRYIFKIALSKWMHTKVVLMPQSFGPFQYSGIIGKLLKVAIRHYMKYPLICFAREKESEKQLRLLVPKAKTRLSEDLVLQNGCIIDDVQEVVPIEQLNHIEPGSIALVVNRRLYEQYGKDKIFKKYVEILRVIIERKRNIYLLCHASDDMDICTELKAKFSEQPLVHMVGKVLSCFEFQVLARNFDYVIAARYHSIVHSYKEGIPCLALGWAVKYQELLESMEQGDYLLNIGIMTTDEIRDKIEYMEQNFHKEKLAIIKLVESAQKGNCFDVMATMLRRENNEYHKFSGVR